MVNAYWVFSYIKANANRVDTAAKRLRNGRTFSQPLWVPPGYHLLMKKENSANTSLCQDINNDRMLWTFGSSKPNWLVELSGRISPDELIQTARQHGYEMDDEEAAEHIKHFDNNNSGTIEFSGKLYLALRGLLEYLLTCWQSSWRF